MPALLELSVISVLVLLLRTMLNMELLDIEPFRPESSRLLLATTTLLLVKKPSLSLLPLMLPELPRTSLRPRLSQPQSSLLPQHHMLPFLLPLSQLDLLPLTPLFRPRSLLPSEPTPESLLRSPTLSHN